jgi:hypothetical protein
MLPEEDERVLSGRRIKCLRQGSFRDPASAGADLTRAPRGKTLYIQTLKSAMRSIRRAKGFGRKRLAVAMAEAETRHLNQDTGGDNYAD